VATELTVNPFCVLGLEPKFDLSDEELDKAYLSRQLQVHPDVNDYRCEEFSMELSSRLNFAYKLLKDPVERGRELLRIFGYWPAPENASLAEQIFEMRDELEEIKQKNGDHAAFKLLLTKKEEAYEIMESAFREKNFPEALNAYTCLMHLNSIVKSIKT